jgi:hypothetical protein
MSLKAQIENDLSQALKNKEGRLSVLRMLKSALQNAVIEKRAKVTAPEGGVVELEDKEILDIIRRQVKQTKDALNDFATGGRTDLAEQAKTELTVLEAYLPAGLPEAELIKVVDEAIAELQATGPGDMGKVMGLVMKKTAGTADGNKVKELVAKKLV